MVKKTAKFFYLFLFIFLMMFFSVENSFEDFYIQKEYQWACFSCIFAIAVSWYHAFFKEDTQKKSDTKQTI